MRTIEAIADCCHRQRHRILEVTKQKHVNDMGVKNRLEIKLFFFYQNYSGEGNLYIYFCIRE